ncbi:signal peptidase II [Pedobacter insulae]|uniref:Lipoprotein signal peptidase n=1 Tax=Pedobacter insulae TaxID=414048 RepID=A0A1I2TQD3_9SPHI|nr:signal peptidase II [Pedobacter insulae]SFG64676.1 signal peptidase II [Pedobacter insulae]
MKRKKTIKLLVLLFLVGLNVGCDQVSKTIVRQKVDYHENISLIKNILTLTKVENTGAFLSMGDNLPVAVRFTLLSLMPIFVLGFGLYYLLTQTDLPELMQLGMSFLLGGGIGNIYDRVMFGSVTDFLHMDLGLFSTGVFNFADVSIMVGIGILLFQSLRGKIIKTQR